MACPGEAAYRVGTGQGDELVIVLGHVDIGAGCDMEQRRYDHLMAEPLELRREGVSVFYGPGDQKPHDHSR